MKYLPLVFILLILVSCEKEPDDQYPKRDYFSCKVNGVPLDLNGDLGCPSKSVYYYSKGTQQLPAGFFSMGGGSCRPYERVSMGVTGLDPNVKTYHPHPSDTIKFLYQPDAFNLIDSALSGQIHFTTIIPQQYDEDGKRTETAKVEGTFHFTVVDTAGTEWKITEGRFGFFNIQ